MPTPPRPRPMLPDPGINTKGEVACNEQLAPGVYCGRYIKPGKPHRGKHRVEWSDR